MASRARSLRFCSSLSKDGNRCFGSKRLLEGWWQAKGRPYFADREVVAQIMYGVQKQIAATVIDFAQGFDGGQRSMLMVGMRINIGGRCHDNIRLERFYQIAKVVHQAVPSRAGLEVLRQ